MNRVPEASSYLPGSVAVPEAMLWKAVRQFGEENGYKPMKTQDLVDEAKELGVIEPKVRRKQRFDASRTAGGVRVRHIPPLKVLRNWYTKKKYRHGGWEAEDAQAGAEPRWEGAACPLDG